MPLDSPHPFFSLWFVFSIINTLKWKSGENGNGNWEHLSREGCLVDKKLDIGGRGPHLNNILDFIIECSSDTRDGRTPDIHKIDSTRLHQ